MIAKSVEKILDLAADNISRMKATIIGRKEECILLQRLLKSAQAELLAIYGRRRVGKTYLIRKK